MNIWTILSLFAVCIINIHNSEAYRILGIFHMGSKSHFHVGSALFKALAKAGHDVTLIAPFKSDKPVENYTEIWLDGYEAHMKEAMKATDLTKMYELSVFAHFPMMFAFGKQITTFAINHPNFKKFLKTKQHFDVAVIEIFLSDALLGLGPHFNAPIIGVSPFGASKWTTDLVGTRDVASYMPNTFLTYSSHMTFWQRMGNALFGVLEDILYPIFYDPKQREMYENTFPGDNKPTLAEIKRNISLVLLNTHVSFGFPRPYAPNMIEVGGMHIKRNPEPLPNDIQKFLDDAKDGAIYFSLGSNIKSFMITEHKKQDILNGFKDFPKMRILFKWDENVLFPSHKVSDVMVRPWFTQESILAHPNVKLFITHGGLLSTQESLYFGKPVVGIPIFGDQYMNMNFAEQAGFGITVPFGQLSDEKLRTAIKTVLTKPSYKEKAELISDRYRDQMNTPTEVAVHWIEHVARNKGAPHLRLAAIDLPFYKYYNLDVYAFIGLSVYLVIFVLRKLLAAVCGRASKNAQTNKTKLH